MYARKVIRPTVYYREVHDRPEDAVRLVGYSEYRLALHYYDQLLRSAKRDELQVMDLLVRRNPQYTVAANLMQRMPQAATSFLTVKGKASRQGLAWVAALARIEHGAIVAAYSKEKEPLSLPGPKAPETQAIDELLLEAAVMHAWALQKDPLLTGRAKTRRPTRSVRSRANARQQKQRLLAYERRITLTWKLLQALQQRAANRLSQAQRRELHLLAQQTNLLRTTFRKRLLGLGTGVRNGR